MSPLHCVSELSKVSKKGVYVWILKSKWIMYPTGLGPVKFYMEIDTSLKPT